MNSSNNIRFYEGEEWEKYIQILLKRHYKLGDYQEIPAKHVGDFGIEGYSTSNLGKVYQCYAVQEPCTTEHRYNSQRDKITTDIQKFIKNKDKFVKLFGNTLINRWILLVPIYDSALLAQHASKKTEEVLQAKLPYVSNDFKVIVTTDDCLSKEIKELSGAGVIDIDIPESEINTESREDWLNSNNSLVINLERKCQKIPSLTSKEKIENFKHLIIDRYLNGQNLLSYLSNNYPQLYANLSNYKLEYENELSMTSLINDFPSNQFLSRTLSEYEQNIKDIAPNLPRATIKKLSGEAISDWLMRCPLDF